MNAIAEVFPSPNTRSLLCIWHVNKAVFTRCRAGFEDTDWERFLAAFYAVIRASSLTAYNDACCQDAMSTTKS